MNRNNKILVGVLAFIVAMTIGYALFSDKITITGTAKAKGDFSVTAACTPGIPKDFPMDDYGVLFSNYFSGKIMADNHYKNDSCSVNGNEITFNAELTQPLAARNFTVKFTNNGSIPASLGLTEEAFNVSIERCEGNFEDDTFSNCATLTDYSSIIDIELLGFEDASGNILFNQNGALEDLSKYIDNENALFVLQSGESMYMRFSAVWNDDDQGIYNGTNKTYYKDTMRARIIFTQKTS